MSASITGSSPGYTYVGFGLGAIQSGLFLYEAMTSGNFKRLVVAEVVPEIGRQVRENGDFLSVNIAHSSGIEKARVGPLEVLDPAAASDRQRLVQALAEAHEIGTAVPGVRFYNSPGPESLSRILAVGLRAKAENNGPRAVMYTAENHNRAAEILEFEVLTHLPPAAHGAVKRQALFLNTVIGKMSGVIVGKAEIASLGLDPMTQGSERAFLVEAFNRILISRAAFPDGDWSPVFQRGITSFIEKDDLLPFEEAKLFGHNATHAVAGYLGALLGVQRIADIPSVPGLLEFLSRAFTEESGAALIQRYAGFDPLFTSSGYASYAADLLGRMTNPWLADTVERVGRDVERKLAWDDRLVGTLRLGLAEGVPMRRYALGTAAALVYLEPHFLEDSIDPAARLLSLWGMEPRDSDQERQMLALICAGLDSLRRWQQADRGNYHALMETP